MVGPRTSELRGGLQQRASTRHSRIESPPCDRSPAEGSRAGASLARRAASAPQPPLAATPQGQTQTQNLTNI
jgi:hypothetical protein